jgi:hypothetical protein
MNYFSKPLTFFHLIGAHLPVWSVTTKYESNAGEEDWIYVECRSVCEYVCDKPIAESHIDALSEHPDVINSIPWYNLSGTELHQTPDSTKIQIDRALVSASSSGSRSVNTIPNEPLKLRFRVYHKFGKTDPKLFTWGCEDHCKYSCMHHVVDERKSILPTRQFHGKWPFKRVFICQEILSSVYSLGNCLPYLILAFSSAFWRLRPILRWLTVSFITVWIASTVFHCRDTNSTMMFDYYSVLFGGLMNVAASSDALFFSNKPQNRFRPIWFASLALVWLSLVTYMTYIKFDFFLHTIASIIIGVSGTVLWSIWYLVNRKTVKHAWMMAVGSISLFPLLIAFEINDFPPGEMGLADAHSFWHLTSIPVACLITTFLFREAVRDQTLLRKQT